MIKGVLFDLGGVFFEDGTDKFIKLLSIKTNKSYDGIYPLFRTGKSLEYRENKITGKAFFNWASKQLDSVINPEELNRMWVSQYTEIIGVREIVLWLKSLGIKVGILSDNVPERVEYLENKYHFLDLFDEKIFSYDVNLTKASSEIFLLAIKRLNVDPKEIVFIDDRQVNLDVAQKIGINTILFKDATTLGNELKKLIG